MTNPPAQGSLAQTLSVLQARGIDRLDAQLLLLHLLGKPPEQRSWLLAHDSDALPAACRVSLEALVQRRLAGEPLAYLTGNKAFYGLTLQVSRDVLVPRPDTETLVDWALQQLAGEATLEPTTTAPWPLSTRPPGSAPGSAIGPVGRAELSVLDLGSGSGAIALALKATRPDLRVWATDMSSAALAVAQANARRLQLELRFCQGCWFAALPADAPLFDCIACNPPYIAMHDPHLAALRFEPLSALTSGADGLDDLRRIVSDAPAYLNAGGWLLLEHGFDQAEQTRRLLVQQGFIAVQSRRDLAGIERCSGGQKPQ